MKTLNKGNDGNLLYKIFEGIFANGLTPKEGKISMSDGS